MICPRCDGTGCVHDTTGQPINENDPHAAHCYRCGGTGSLDGLDETMTTDREERDFTRGKLGE